MEEAPGVGGTSLVHDDFERLHPRLLAVVGAVGSVSAVQQGSPLSDEWSPRSWLNFDLRGHSRNLGEPFLDITRVSDRSASLTGVDVGQVARRPGTVTA